MDSAHLCFAIYIAVVPVAATANDEFPPIISGWLEATANIRTVRASVQIIQYDGTFHIQKHATGSFGYLSKYQGFWQFHNDTGEHHKRAVTPTGVSYEICPFEDRHWRWHAHRFRDIDDRHESFIEHTLAPNPESHGWFLFGAGVFRTVDWATPFLPGHPNKDVAAEWMFSVTKQSDSHTWVRAVPKPDAPQSRLLHSCDIYFQHDPVRLLATRSTDITGSNRTVIIYSDVQFDPEPWSEPDLTEYKQINLPDQPEK